MRPIANLRAWAASAALCAAAAPAVALGQTPPAKAPAPAAAPAQAGAAQTSPGFRSDAPIDVTADTLEVFRDQRLTIFRGNVEAIQDNVRIRSPELRLFSEARAANAPGAAVGAAGSSFGAIERMEAAGPVYYITPTQQAKGDHAVYEKAPDTITMTGHVVITQDKNVVTGDKLVIEQKTGHSTMVANASGPNPSKRVRGVFYPQPAPPPGAPAPAAKPAAKARAPASAPARGKRP